MPDVMLLVFLLSAAANVNFLCYNGSALHPNLTNRFNLSSLNPQPCYKTHCGVTVSKSHLFKYSFGCFDNLECNENQCNRVDDGLQCCCNTNSLCNVQDQLHHKIWAHYSSNSQTTAPTSLPGISCSDSSTSFGWRNIVIVTLSVVIGCQIIVIIVLSVFMCRGNKKPVKTRKSSTARNRKVLSVAPMVLPATNEASMTMAPSTVVAVKRASAPRAGKKVGSGADEESDIERTAQNGNEKTFNKTGDLGTLAPTTPDDEAPRYW